MINLRIRSISGASALSSEPDPFGRPWETAALEGFRWPAFWLLGGAAAAGSCVVDEDSAICLGEGSPAGASARARSDLRTNRWPLSSDRLLVPCLITQWKKLSSAHRLLGTGRIRLSNL
jgi:hypothetical protein